MEMEGEEEKKEEYKGKKGGGKLRQEETSVCMFVCIPGGLMGGILSAQGLRAGGIHAEHMHTGWFTHSVV